jgi:hypothetical protein
VTVWGEAVVHGVERFSEDCMEERYGGGDGTAHTLEILYVNGRLKDEFITGCEEGES